MKLEVGQFVRTKEGYIAKIIKEIKDERRKEFVLDRIVVLNKRCTEIIRRNDNVISSHNIIDLVEVGDYVNGVLITDISEDNKGKYVFGYSKDGFEGEIWFYNNEIKSIVTKEQFEAMAYKVV